MQFEVSSEGDVTVVSVRGELDAKTAPEVRAALDRVVEQQPDRVLVELSRLRLIDSTGVGAIVSLFKRVRAYGGKFEVKGVTGQPWTIFQVLRLDKVFALKRSPTK
jgi:anti-sigma B factor antagonist